MSIYLYLTNTGFYLQTKPAVLFILKLKKYPYEKNNQRRYKAGSFQFIR